MHIGCHCATGETETHHAGRAGLSLRVVVEAFIPQAGMRSFKKSRDRWEFDDLPLLRSLHALDPNDTR